MEPCSAKAGGGSARRKEDVENQANGDRGIGLILGFPDREWIAMTQYGVRSFDPVKHRRFGPVSKNSARYPSVAAPPPAWVRRSTAGCDRHHRSIRAVCAVLVATQGRRPSRRRLCRQLWSTLPTPRKDLIPSRTTAVTNTASTTGCRSTAWLRRNASSRNIAMGNRRQPSPQSGSSPLEVQSTTTGQHLTCDVVRKR